VKFVWFIAIVLVISLISINPLFGQPVSTKVKDLYFQSVAFPEEFDTSFELLEASGHSKTEILACLIYLRATNYQMAQAVINQCETAHGGDPNAKWQCLKDDQSASMAYWADGMIRVIKDGQSWTGTYTGRNMSTAKALSERIQPGSWVDGIRMTMPMISFACP